MFEHYDIAIVGGGLAGGSLALALRDSGYRVALVEAFSDEQRRVSPSGDRALALSYGTVCLLKSMGLWQGMAQNCAAIREIHISDRGHFAKARLSARKEGVDALGYVITARPLEDHIASSLENSNVFRICPARLTGFQAGPDWDCLTLDKAGEVLSLSARLVVGADGIHSAVRRFLDIAQEVRDYQQTAIVTQVRPDIDPDGLAFERFTAFGPLAMLPTLESSCAVVWTQKNDIAKRLITLDDKGFLNCLQDAFGFRLGRLDLKTERVQFPLKLVRAKKMVGHRSVLIGNTVHQLHPVAGQGFNLGMRDVALLAEMIRDDSRNGRDPGAEALLKRYAAARSRDHEILVRFTDGVVRMFSNDWIPLAGARGLGLFGLDRCYPVKHLLTRHAMGLGGRMPRFGVQSDNLHE